MQIQSLAELCINQIYENKFLEEKKTRFNEYLHFIKSILINKNNNNPSYIKKEIKQFHESLILSNNTLKKEKNNLNNKLLLYRDDLSKDSSFSDKQKLINAKSDNLILICQIKEKDDIINRLKSAIETAKKNVYFKESKREVSVNNKWGKYYITINLNSTGTKMMGECQNFIQYNNKCFKKEKEKIKINTKKQYYSDIINFFRKELGNEINNEGKNKKVKNSNKNNKKFLTQTMILKNEKELSLFDCKDDYLNENLLIEQEKNKNELNLNQTIQYMEDSKYGKNIIHEINKNKKNKKSKINFLTVDELFDVNNHEGKEEAIIDDELHSDEETTFEIKIKPLKKIGIHYIPKIRKQVPIINLSQIEYNKQKIMNEADLYSLQKRKYKNQNVEENIKTMQKKVKKFKNKCKLNKKKMEAFENYAKNIENNYKVLKPLKIQSSLGGAKIPKILMNGFKNDNQFDDIDLGDNDSDNLEEGESDTKNDTFNFTKLPDKNYIINHLDNKNFKQKDNDKKISPENNNLNRANSK